MKRRLQLALTVIIVGLCAWLSFQIGGRHHEPAAGASPHQASPSASRTEPRGQSEASPSPTAGSPPLQQPFIEVARWTLQAPNPAPLAPEETLASRQVRAIGVVKQRPAKPLESLHAGERLVLPVRLGPPLTGIVNLVHKDEGGWVRVGGSVEGDAQGGFSLSQKGEEWHGIIRHAGSGTAYLLTTTADGSLQLIEKPLGSVQCLANPRRPRTNDAGVMNADGSGGGGPSSAASVVVPALDSLPSATHVVYLDFDGEVVNDPDWNSGFTINAQPPTIGSGPISEAMITSIWKRVAEDMRPYNIAVTTIPSRYSAAGPGKRMRCIITPTDAASPGAGGVAYVDSYDQAGTFYSSTIPCWAFTESYYNANDIAGTISHEVGHTFGLSHDGLYPDSDPRHEEYYDGHGSGATSWGPIMGTTYDRSVSQWSKGEYANASNTENDLAIIGSAANGFLTRADEAADSIPATLLANTGVFDQYGIIGSGTDADLFQFSTAGGPVVIDAAPSEVGPNLDLILELRAADGSTVLKSSNPTGPVKASLTYTAPAGAYVIAVRGTGYGTASTGYTAYGSIGEYRISGTFPAVPDTAPSIIGQPQSVTVSAGGKAVFSVSAISNVAATYQWTKNDVPIGGQTRSTLTLSKVLPSAAGDYRCIVSNSVGDTVSDPATLTVNFKPAITQQPVSQSATAGGGVTLSCAADGVPVPAFQWQKNGVDLPGATTSDLLIPAVQWADGGKYRCVASNLLGRVTSRTVTLTIVSAPVILVPPPATSLVPLNGSAVIAITAAGTGKLSYQWFHNGSRLDGRTSNRLALTRITPAMAGTYRCDVTNALGTISSTDCVVTVQDSPVIVSDPASITVARGRRTTLRVAAVGAPVLKYAWLKNGAPISGSAPSLTVIAAADADYQAVVTNSFGQATSSMAHVTVHDPPKIITRPLSQTKALGGSVTFSVVATGTAPLAYQWTKNKVPVAGADTDALTLNNLAATDAGLYACIVSNDVGTAASPSAQLKLQTAPSITQHPSSATVDAFASVIFKATAAGTATLKYQWQKDGVDIRGATSSSYKIANVHPDNAGDYRVHVTNLVGDAFSTAATLTVNDVAAPSVTGFFPPIGKAGHYVRVFGTNLNWTTGVQFRNASGNPVRAAFVVVSPTEILVTVPSGAATSAIEVMTRGGTAQTVAQFTVSASGNTNDDLANARVIPGAGGSVTGSNTQFTAEAGEPRHALPPGYSYPEDFDAVYSGWFQWTPSVSGSYYVSTAGSAFDTRVAIYTGSSMNSLSLVGFDDDQDPDRDIYTSRAYIVATAGTTYYIAIDGFLYDYSGAGDFYDERGSYKIAVTRIASSTTLASTERNPWLSADTVSTSNKGLMLGGPTHSGGGGSQLVWLHSAPAPDATLINATATLCYTRGGGQFGLVAYDQEASPMFGFNIDASSGALSVLTPAGSASTGRRITPDQPHAFALQMDRAASTWGVTVNGVWICRNQPIPDGVSFADLAVQWFPATDLDPASTVNVSDAEITAGNEENAVPVEANGDR